jgi:hypothetical protein
MKPRINELQATEARLRADVVSATIIAFGLLATMFWNLSVAWLALRLLDVL